MTILRHQVLGKELFTTLDVCLTCLANTETNDRACIAQGKPRQHYARASLIGGSVCYAVLEHLGYGPIKDLRWRLDQGVDQAVEYFLGDWWRDNEEDSRALDRTRPDRCLRWFDVFPHALLLGGLTSRWDDLAKICSWFDESIELEYQAGQIEDQYMLLFLCIASSLRPQAMARLDELVAKVKNCRTKRPKLLCAAWEAAVARDQKGFDKALKQSVSHFLKVDARNVPNVNFWVALHPSIVWLIAERNGLVFPELPDELEAAVVTRQTTGLA